MKDTILISSSSFGMSEEATKILWKVVAKGKVTVIKATETCLPIPFDQITGIIAGTEVYDEITLASMSNLKVISRMGVGLDEIDLEYCAAHGITVTYTPYGPTISVAEMTIGFMISLLRNMHLSNIDMHLDLWTKRMGQQFSEVNIGILGFGRIGSEVVRLLSHFNPKRIYVCDIDITKERPLGTYFKFVNITKLFRTCDLISLHIPLGRNNFHLIDKGLFNFMKPNSFIINTSRGALINEDDLYSALTVGRLAGAAIDVFEKEPYDGQLTKLKNVIISPHNSSMTQTARDNMETGAVEDCLRVLDNKHPINEVTYEL